VAVCPCPLQASEDLAHTCQVGVLSPEVSPPYQEVFKEIADGIAQRVGADALCSMVLNNPADPARLQDFIHARSPQSVVTLGRVPTQAYEASGAGSPQLIGALDISPRTRRAASGVSLAVDPDRLFEWLRRVAPTVKRVWVVYDPRREAWVMERTRRAAAARGLELHAGTASTLLEAAPQYGEYVRRARRGLDALWLTSNRALTGDPNLLSYLIEQAWLRQVIVFSERLEDAQAGVLFASYPDTKALGRRLGALALRLAAEPSEPLGIEPLQDIKVAVNARVARHLGLIQGQEDLRRFDRVLERGRDRMSPRAGRLREALKDSLPRPAVLGLLLLTAAGVSSVSWFMYAQFWQLLIGQGSQIAQQFAQTGLSVFLVKDPAGIQQAAQVFGHFPGVRCLAVVDTQGIARFESSSYTTTSLRPPGAPLAQAGLLDEDTHTWRFAAPIISPGALDTSPVSELAGAGPQTLGQVLVDIDKSSLRSLAYLLIGLNAAVLMVLTAAVLRWDSQVREVDRQKAAFMATVTHEMRTPLHGILGNTQLALEALEVYEEPPDLATLEAVMASGRQLSALIDRILDAHRLGAGKMELNVEPTDLRAIVEEAVCVTGPGIARNGNRLIQVIQSEGPIYIDRDKLQQVLQNLLGNAGKFTYEGVVTLRVEHTPAWLHIEVEDTGIGIPADQRAHIFEPFRKARHPRCPQV
jgi:putative ABC transport system substrate-binding protein